MSAHIKSTYLVRFFGFLFAMVGVFFPSASPVEARVDYHGYYFAENDLLNLHNMSEVASSTNLLKLGHEYIQGNFQTLANKVRANGFTAIDMMLWLNEDAFVNAHGERDAYLQLVKKHLYQDSDLGKMLKFIQLHEEPYSWIKYGFFNWSIFNNINYLECRDRYGAANINSFQDCKNKMMKEGLEKYIDDIHKYFPGIPVVIVETKWDDYYVPPANLDILGLDPYYIPTSTACDATQRAKFDAEVTTYINRAKAFGKPIQFVGGAFQVGGYVMPSQCQAQWSIDIAKNTPEITSFNWFLWSTTEGVTGVRDFPQLANFLKEEGKKMINQNVAPVITSVDINPKPIKPDGRSTYRARIITSDNNGADDIRVQYLLINQNGQGQNGGQFRGYVGWSKDGDLTSKYYFPATSGVPITCEGGGKAYKAVGYGEEYINIQSCVTTVTGNSRMTTFVVTFNKNFKTPTAFNTISGWAADAGLLRAPWITFNTFNLEGYPPIIID